MEPRIQYAKTKDGVSIAFTTVGKGTPLVVAGDISDSHVQLVWDSPPSGPLFKFLAGKHTVVKFDPRGFGLSDRDVSAFSLDSRLLDLEAAVDHLGLTRFTILGIGVLGVLLRWLSLPNIPSAYPVWYLRAPPFARPIF